MAQTVRRGGSLMRSCLIWMVRTERFELPTY